MLKMVQITMYKAIIICHAKGVEGSVHIHE